MNANIKIDNVNYSGNKKFVKSSNGKILLLSKHRSTIDTINDILKENNIKIKVFGSVDGTFEELPPFDSTVIILDITLESQHTLEAIL